MEGNAVGGVAPWDGGGRIGRLLFSGPKTGKVDITVTGRSTPMPRTGRAMGIMVLYPIPAMKRGPLACRSPSFFCNIYLFIYLFIYIFFFFLGHTLAIDIFV